MRHFCILLPRIVVLFVCCSLLSNPTQAQTFCDPNSTPNTNGPLRAWAQNAIVSVNVNSSQFTQDEFYNCILPVFDNFNLANGATQAGYGNFSGVSFSVTYSPNAVASIDPLSGDATNASGISNGLQINRDTLRDKERGTTASGNNGTNRNSAVIRQNSNLTDCQAIQENMAHETGHTMGLGHCGGCGTCNCASGSSIMRITTCPSGVNAMTCLNSSGQGHTSPSQCDNQRIQQSANYNSSTMSQYNPNSGGDCSTEQAQACYAESPWNRWDDFACLCRRLPGECGGGVNCTPILVDVGGNGFNLTDVQNGVGFDLDADGVISGRLSWTSSLSDDAWLSLDRNSNGTIDSGEELFGNFSPQADPLGGIERNGFRALAEYDKFENGGNGDGVISSLDGIFVSLRLWQDMNHNGVSEPNELHTLSDLGLATVDFDYRESRRTDEFGNIFKYRSKVKDDHGAQLGRWAWDVVLSTGQ